MRKLLRLLALIATFFAGAFVPAAHAAKRAKPKKPTADANRDRIPDRWERRHKLSLKRNQAARDQDRDGLNNANEYLRGSSPRDKDSDDDGVGDADEALGTIAKHKGLRLVIKLGNGRDVRGTVDEDTLVLCPAEATTDYDEDPGDDEDLYGDESLPDDAKETGDDAADDLPVDEDDVDDDLDDDLPFDDTADCALTDLVVGAPVQAATLTLTSRGARFEEIELAA